MFKHNFYTPIRSFLWLVAYLKLCVWLVRNWSAKSCSLKLYLHMFSSCHMAGAGPEGVLTVWKCALANITEEMHSKLTPLKKVYFNFLPSGYKPGWLAAFHDHDILGMTLHSHNILSMFHSHIKWRKRRNLQRRTLSMLHKKMVIWE